VPREHLSFWDDARARVAGCARKRTDAPRIKPAEESVEMSRFPFGIPLGWYPVAWSFELERGAVAKRRYFARELVVYRGESGEAFVLDAHCPHLGAHLGVGGKVEGDTIRCPFHGWRFSGAGSVEIPYLESEADGSHVGPRRGYPARELGAPSGPGITKGDAPSLRAARGLEFGADGRTREWTHYEWTIRTHPQEIAENSVDWPHFHHIHHMEPPPDRAVRFEDHEIRWHAATTKTLRRWTVGRRDPESSGATRARVQLRALFGDARDGHHHGMTPVDDERVHMRFGVIGKKSGRERRRDGVLPPAYADDMAVAVEQVS
jgi:phenylpropionate dioxygenase-like ring-hydroxylating dioxygenase large terminal subunit